MKEKNTNTIYIIETSSGTMVSKVIRIFTKYRYSHIMLSLDNKFDKMYTFGRRTPENPFNSGFIIESTNGPFYTKFNETSCVIYEMKIGKKKFKTLKKLIARYEKNPKKYNYDIIGLCLRLFKITIKRKNRHVCCSFVAEIINQSKIYDFNKPCQKVKPIDFESIPNKKLYYSGKLVNCPTSNIN